MRTCPNCTAQNAATAKFCASCGAALPPSSAPVPPTPFLPMFSYKACAVFLIAGTTLYNIVTPKSGINPAYMPHNWFFTNGPAIAFTLLAIGVVHLAVSILRSLRGG